MTSLLAGIRCACLPFIQFVLRLDKGFSTILDSVTHGRVRSCCGLLVCLGVGFGSPVGADGGDIRAVLIGIDNYQSDQISELRGAVNDARLIEGTLTHYLGVKPENISVLLNERATADAIVRTVEERLIDAARQDDVAIVYFSGRGSKVRDEDEGDEIDGYDETLLAYDSRVDAIPPITDDAIHELLSRVSQRTPHTIFIYDSSHADSGADTTRAANRAAAANEQAPPASPKAAINRESGDDVTDLRPNGASYTVLSASAGSQPAYELKLDGRYHGIFTWTLSRMLRSLTGESTYGELVSDLVAEMHPYQPDQRPVIQGVDSDTVVFGMQHAGQTPFLRITDVSGSTVLLNGGRAAGIRNDQTLAIYPPLATEYEPVDSVGELTIVGVQEFSAIARITRGETLEPDSRVPLHNAAVSQEKLAVHIDAESAEFESLVAEKVSTVTDAVVVDGKDDSLVSISQHGDLVKVKADSSELVSPTIWSMSADRFGEVASSIERLIQRVSALSLSNRSVGHEATLEIFADQNLQIPVDRGSVDSGSVVYYRIVNRSASDYYIYLLHVAKGGGVKLVYPVDLSERNKLSAGMSFINRLQVSQLSGERKSADYLKLIVTERPVNAKRSGTEILSLIGHNEKSSNQQTLETRSVEGALLNGIRHQRDTQNPSGLTSSWSSITRAIEIRRTDLRSAGFAVTVDSSAASQDVETIVRRGIRSGFNAPSGEHIGCTDDQVVLALEGLAEAVGQPYCFDVKARGPDGLIVHLIPASDSAFEKRDMIASEHFQLAYQLHDSIEGAVRVEPLFDAQAQIETDSHTNEWSILSELDRWSHHMITATDAWLKLRQQKQARTGAEASGVRIAHIDSGYTNHPELQLSATGVAPVLADFGYDYVDDDTDPEDQLLGSTDSLSSATVSGSVIASPPDEFPGCQLSQQLAGDEINGCISGVAPGAQLIPLRAHETLERGNTDALVAAIYDVASARQGLSSRIQGRPQIISMAISGLPTLTLWHAVREAERAGVLQFAATGDRAGFVDWPASFESTIATAAIDVECKPWRRSATGARVDVSAPGDAVWLADFNDKKQPINRRHSSMAIASSHVAGAAALWLAYHNESTQLRRLQDNGEVTRFFRYALQDSSWRPSINAANNPDGTHCSTQSWRLHDMGPGILDADALLDVALDFPSTGNRRTEIPDLPLFSSIYPEGTSAETIRNDFLAIFSAGRLPGSQPLTGDSVVAIERAMFETEILHHYALDQDLRVSIDSMIRGSRSKEPVARVINALRDLSLSPQLRHAVSS